MSRFKLGALIAAVVALIIAGVFFLVGYLRPKGAGLSIETLPTATVFIDGVQVGRTPYEETMKPGEVVLKLVPDSFEKPLAAYETRVTLASGVKTVIKREFGESDDSASGEIVSFERVGGNETSLAIVTVPDASQISIDGVVGGFSPYKTASIAPGEHQLTISSSGFVEKRLRVRTYPGYKLTAVVKLAREEKPAEEKAEEEVSGKEEKITEVEILSTPTGFLRVRAEPSTASEEIGRVTPDERYPLLEQDEKTGWFKIEFGKGEPGLTAQAGWISNQYAEKVEESSSDETSEGKEEKELPTPTSTPSSTLVPSPTF